MHGSRWNLKTEDSEDELTIFSGRTRFVSSKRGSQSPTSFPPHPVDTSATHYHHQAIPHEAQPISAAPSYYSDTSLSSSPSVANWVPNSRRDEYVEPRREQQYNPIHDCHTTPQQYQPMSHYRTQEQVPVVAAPVNYQWQQSHPNPSQYYTNQPEQPYAPAHHDNNYRQQQQQQQPPVFTAPYQNTHQPLPPPSELADLGLAARDSRLDERWSSFMQDSGLLDGDNYNQTRGR